MKSDIEALKLLDLEVGDVLSIIELDDRAEKLFKDDDMESYLSQFHYDEVIEWKEYHLYEEESQEFPYIVYFELVEYREDYSLIRII